MKKQIESGWIAMIDNRRNALRHLDVASQHRFMQGLAWMWGIVVSLAVVAIFSFGLIWLGQLLVAGGIAMTVAVFREAQNQRIAVPVPDGHRSQPSKCVWKLDSEA
jgi:hypothetical protein